MDLLKKCFDELGIDIDEIKISQFSRYYDLLISWNEKFNLTSITDKDDVIIKHFVDSVILLKYMVLSGKSVLDVGTGAGFPGIPLKIMCPDISLVLVDSLNKRITFLDEVISELGLLGCETVHSRAEDLALNKDFRDGFDIVTSRAVAGLNVLTEYCLPFVKKEGLFISYKSGKVDEEIAQAKNAIKTLGGISGSLYEYTLPQSDIGRSLVCIRKISYTPKQFPRKAGIPSKKPL